MTPSSELWTTAGVTRLPAYARLWNRRLLCLFVHLALLVHFLHFVHLVFLVLFALLISHLIGAHLVLIAAHFLALVPALHFLVLSLRQAQGRPARERHTYRKGRHQNCDSLPHGLDSSFGQSG